MMKTNIYVLKLKENKYYVGKSKDIEKRFEEHLKGEGSEWTKLYKPEKILKIFENVSVFEEDRITKEYMYIFGIDNVRGGTYTSIELDEEEEHFIYREIWSATDKCTLCGRSGHFVKDCYAKTDILGNEIVYEESEDDDEDEEDDEEDDEEEDDEDE